MKESVEFADQAVMQKVCGANDSNLPYMEVLCSVELASLGNRIEVESGDSDTLKRTLLLIDNLKRYPSKSVTQSEIFLEYSSLISGAEESCPALELITLGNRTIYPKSAMQRRYISEMLHKQIVFASGPAGTGKTYLAVAYALSLLLSGKVRKIVLTRPVVEAGESLGFLPGDLFQKISPYLRPLYDAMEAMISTDHIRRLQENGSIEIAPLAYMRGRSIQNAAVILDEAQNTTKAQMLMLLTRIGESSRAIITGDVSQVDLPGRTQSGLVHALKVLSPVDEIGMVRFDSSDVVRSRIVQKIIDAYALDGKER